MLQDHIWNQHCSRSMFAICSCSSGDSKYGPGDLKYSSRLLMVLDHKVLMIQDYIIGPKSHKSVVYAECININESFHQHWRGCLKDEGNGTSKNYVENVRKELKWMSSNKGERAEKNKTKQNKTKQNKTKQNKTKQNKTKQNKTKTKQKQKQMQKNKTKQNNNYNKQAHRGRAYCNLVGRVGRTGDEVHYHSS